MAKRLKIPAERGPLLDGVLFDAPGESDTVVIAITGIHGNFYSNPFYVNFGETLNAGGIDFVYAQTCDAFGQIETEDWRTGERVVIGSQTEDFGDTVDDVRAYVNWAERRGYEHIYLGGRFPRRRASSVTVARSYNRPSGSRFPAALCKTLQGGIENADFGQSGGNAREY